MGRRIYSMLYWYVCAYLMGHFRLHFQLLACIFLLLVHQQSSCQISVRVCAFWFFNERVEKSFVINFSFRNQR